MYCVFINLAIIDFQLQPMNIKGNEVRKIARNTFRNVCTPMNHKRLLQFTPEHSALWHAVGTVRL